MYIKYKNHILLTVNQSQGISMCKGGYSNQRKNATTQNNYYFHPRFRDRSLLDFRTETTCSFPSGTNIFRDTVALFTGTKELQHMANIATSRSNRDLKINFAAKTNPPFEFKSIAFRRPVCLAFGMPYSKSNPTD